MRMSPVGKVDHLLGLPVGLAFDLQFPAGARLSTIRSTDLTILCLGMDPTLHRDLPRLGRLHTRCIDHD